MGFALYCIFNLQKREKRSLVTGLGPYYSYPNYLELVIVMDNGVFIKLGANKNNCTTYAIAVANIMHVVNIF